MSQRKMQPQVEIVGFDGRNLLEALALLQNVSSRSMSDSAERYTREHLMSRAEQPFLQEWDHVVYGRVYGLRNERFGVVYDSVPDAPEVVIETRSGAPATVLATFWIRP